VLRHPDWEIGFYRDGFWSAVFGGAVLVGLGGVENWELELRPNSGEKVILSENYTVDIALQLQNLGETFNSLGIYTALNSLSHAH